MYKMLAFCNDLWYYGGYKGRKKDFPIKCTAKFTTLRVAERMAKAMNISGVTQTAQVLPQTQPQAAEPAPEASAAQASMGTDAVAFSSQVSTQVMDMAQRQFEDAANELISSMAASTGVGSNIDVSV